MRAVTDSASTPASIASTYTGRIVWNRPRQFAATLAHDPSRDTEGAHTYRIRVIDGRGNSGYSDTWNVHTDRTAPTTSASGFDAAYNVGPAATGSSLVSTPTGLGPSDVGDDLGYTTDEGATIPEGDVEATGSDSRSPYSIYAYAAGDNDYYQEILCAGPTNPCGTYDGRAAAAYAVRFNLTQCGTSDSCAQRERNHDYDYFGGRGGDCTNFASQALKAGGMRFMRARGVTTTNANRAGFDKYLDGPGAWWAYFWDTPYYGNSPFKIRSYKPTPTCRSNDLYEHLTGYGLGAVVRRSRVRAEISCSTICIQAIPTTDITTHRS